MSVVEKESAADRSERIAALTPEQRELLALLRRRKAAEKRPRRPPTAPPIPPRGPGESSPLSFDQERLWFLYYLDPGATAYNIDTSTRMEGRLDVAALVRSLNGVVARHEAWRTTFQARDGRPVQVVAPEVPLHVPVVDLRRVPAGCRDAVARAHQRSEARRPFDLAAGPLVRALLLRLTDDSWICMLTVHHIVTDWVTFQLFWRELALLYTGETRLLPALPRQYADFAVWQRDWLSGEVLETYLDFWLRELADAPQVLDLPFDRPRPPIQTTRGAEAAVEIPGSLADGLKALARQAGATPFMAVLAVFDALLCRLTGQGKVLVGSPNANRNRAELEPLFGFFLTQLVFVADGSGNPTFRELLGRVRRQALGAYAHQDLPFGKLLEAMRPERDNSRPPLIQANFLLLDSEYTPMELPELQVTPIWVDDGNSRFDMTLGLWDSPSRIFGFFEYNLDLFDPTTVARMAEAFSALVERAVADPEVRLADLPMLSAAARHQVLGEWNDTGVGEREPTVPDLFAARVRERPAALALVCAHASDAEISFAALDRAADRAARRLQAAGIGRGDVVGLALDRSPALGVGVLALWKAGAVLLPLDPAAPRERLAFLVADAGAKALLTRASLRGRLPETDLPVLDLLDLENGEAATSAAISELPLPRVGPDDLAYLLYTSGTTGQPKGVAVEHGNLSAILAACRREFRFRPSDRFLAVAPFSFDIFFFELLSPLLAGGCCDLFAATSPLDMDALLKSLERATLFHAVPALLRQVLAAVPAIRRENPAAFAALRTVFVGGDAVPADLLASLAESFPQAEARVLYGPTEATILATTERIAAGSSSAPAGPAARVGTALGRPLPGVRLRVVDPSGGLAAVGVAGELWIGGSGVSRGYSGRESGLAELTADRFVWVEGERWYRTGDRVRLDGWGGLEFLGRIDGQVKIRGFRVEPGEVEAALAADPEVAESVVVARTLAGNSSGDKQLVAYVVPRQGQGPEEGRTELWTGRLAERLRERLPGHLVPSLFVPLDALPLTPHGKVDRKALPAVDAIAGNTGSAGSAAAPRNEREAALAAVWQGVLGLERVGIHDNFFQIGGDSILSIQVVARARKTGLLLTPKQLFEHQTIAGLAAVATSMSTAEGMAADAGPVTGEAPLTPIQRAFFAEFRPEPWRFNQALLFVSRAALDPRLLAAALDVLVDHHDALRLRFTREGEGWKQTHAPTGCGAPLVTADLSALPAGRVSPAIEGAVAALQGGFDLAHGPLFLGALFRCAAGDDDRLRPRLLLAAHHLVVDGVSWRILLEDLEIAYSRLAAGERPDLPARTTSFKTWAERLAVHARLGKVRAELGFWRSQDGGSPLPLDFPGGGNLARSAATVSVELPERQTRELLRQAPAAYRTRVDELLLAALARVLARATGGTRVLLDVEGHGREETLAAGTDLSRTVGWFTSLFPLALDLPGAPGPGAAIQAVKEQLRAVPAKGIGYGLLRWPADSTEASKLAGRPTPEVSFNYLGQVDAQLAETALLAPAAEAIRGTESPGAPRSHLLDVSGIVLGERLRLDLTYSAELHRAATIEALATDLRAEIAALVDHCLSPEAGGYTPSDFPLARLEQGELDALFGRERGIEDLYPLAPLQQGMLFHTLFSPGSELYFEQLTAVLRGPLDVAAFTRAWQRVIDRHPALCAAFLWEGAEAPLREPLQVIRRDATVDWEVLDWREAGEPAADIEIRFRALAAADRRRGFDLARPPLLRLTFVRTGPTEHRLLWSFHHLLFDGWCFSLLFSEVFALYAGLASGTEPLLPPVHPYRDYIAWLAERDPAEAEGFWRRSLAGFVVPTPLPYDHEAAGPGLVAADYREPGLNVGPAATATLVALAQRLGVTLNVLLQGAWALLLSRFAREADVVFGTVVSGRPADLPEVESIVGLFINTVPVRTTVPAAGSLAAWLRALGAAQAERSQQEWTPLARIQALSDVPAGEPLFASLFLFENYPLDAGIAGTAARISGLAIDDVAISERTNYALTLTAAARGGDLTLRLLHDRRFEPATARRLLGHLAGLLEGFVADPERAPLDVPLLDAAERHQLLVEWADTGFLDLTSAPESFRARAAENPGALAVIAGDAGDERLTYGELAHHAERLARRLRALGLGREAVVGLAVGRSLALAVGVLGILEAGAAWVPLDPALPAERLAFLFADSGARAVVTEERFAAGLPTGELPVLLAFAADTGETVEKTEEPLPQVSPRDLAYVLYTSGTTGQPKGVLVEHGQLAWILAASRRTLGWGRDERVLALAPFSFDISIWELLEPLTQGGACEIFPLDPAPDLVQLSQSLRLATRMHAVPALMRQVAATIRDEGGTYPRLRALYMAGEAVPAALQVEIARLFPGVDVRVLYGPTEGAVFCSGWRVEGDGRAAPLGRAFPGASFRLVDPAGLPMPIGAPGELWLGGAGVARGYRGRPELTAERFVPGPGGERWYRTGDLARLGPDGNLEFLGRLDDQVKIRGVRIEPGEIEAVLSALPEVREAAVLAPANERGDRRLVAFVVPDSPDLAGESCAPERLAAGLRAVLPEPLVPAAFVALKALPRTAHGKLDRRVLVALAALAPTSTSVAAGPGRALPRNAAEAALAAVWRGVLGIEEVGLDDNFFRLGGDSILSLQVVARARRAGIVLTPRQLFEHPTIAALAALVEEAGFGGETLPGLASDEPGPVVGEAPLIPIQRWFLETAGPDRHHFAQAVLLDASGALDPRGAGVLATALGALADHHDALRLRFTRHPDGDWRQAHAPAGEGVPFLTVDLSALPEVRFGAAVTAAATALQTGFDLGRGPLFLGALLLGSIGDSAGRRARLLLAAHHLVVDTVSWRILLEDLETAWDRLAAGLPLLLPAKTTSFKSWGDGLERAVRSPALDADRAYWLDGLAGPGSAASAAGTSLPAELGAAGGPPESISLALSPEATEALLRRAPAAYRTQVNDLLLTALGLALGADRSPVRIDLEGHGREGELVPGADLSRTVGWFTSLFPLALDLRDVSPGPPERPGDLGGAIRRVKETLRGLPRRGLGYGLLRYLGSAEEQRLLAAAESAQPVEVAFNYLGQLDLSFAETSRFRLAAEPSGSGAGAGGPRRHVLEINAMVLDDRLRVDWAFATGPGARPAAERLGRSFLTALESLIEHCLSPEAGGLTASDFPLARLDELAGADWETLHGLLGGAGDMPEIRKVEDLYPLAPLQEGMLFHDLYAPGSGLYLQQLSCTLEGPLDRAAFHRAWQGVVDRHPALRTAFVWQGLPRPLQVVRRGVVLPWDEIDFRRERDERDGSAESAEPRFERLAGEIRARGLDPGRAPLLGAVLVRTGEEEARFLWTFHHLLFDGWCFALLFRDVFALYAAEVAGPGAAAVLPPAPPYRDYIAWLARRDAADSEAYWRGVLAGFAAATPLPLDRPRDSGAGGDLEILLPAAATLDLTAFARAAELTLNSACQGAWALLLSRYGGGDDVVFGTVVAGRPPELPGVEEMVGLFINTLPVRHRLDPAEPVGELLRRAQAAQVEMRQHEQAPLALVQRWSEVPPGEPLFLSLFVFENFPVDDSLARGVGPLAVRDLRIADRTDYPLSIALSPATLSGRLSLRFAWDGHLEPTTVLRLARHYEILLTGLAGLVDLGGGGGEQPVGALPLLSAAERRQLLGEWGMGAAVVESKPALLLHQLVAAQAARTPDALAILHGERAISYAGLARAAAALARRLRPLGVGPEVRVPLLTERSPEAIVGIVAVLAAGGAYVPLDPGSPAERLTILLAEIGGIASAVGSHPPPVLPPSPPTTPPRGEEPFGEGPLEPERRPAERPEPPSVEGPLAPARRPAVRPSPLGGRVEGDGGRIGGGWNCDDPFLPRRIPVPLLLTARTAALLPEEARAGFLPVFLDDVLAAGPSEGEVPAGLPEDALPENLAYVLYTSGSTGNPKGVMVSHGAIAAYVRAMVAEYGVGPGDRELQASALSFDPSIEEIFTPLTAGGAVVLPEGAFEEPARFLDFARRTALTLLSLPTAYWHTFVATLAAEDLPAPPEARVVIIGGERALPERWAEWGQLAAGSWGGVRLVNAYGPTEATVGATLEIHPGPSAASGTAGEVAIGRPLPGVVVRVVGLDGPRRSGAGNVVGATEEPLPAGAAGELLLGGLGLARGYLDHPALTAERFVPDPGGAFRGEPGARLYRTGDRVRFLADGRLEFLGRVDSQVKVRGFRIELGEVEGALAAHPAVLEAAAGTREDASGSRSLVAWVVAREAGPAADAADVLDASTLARFLAGRLPAPLVPTEITFLPALPRNASDKVDRRALARLVPARAGAAGAAAGDSYLAPRNAMEEEVAALWRDLLGISRVGVEDDFFALGGHSLLATQLVSRLRRQLGVELPLARLFELRTLAAVSREVLDLKLAAEGEGVDDLLADLDGLSDEEALALLASQEASEEEEDDPEERR